MKRYRVLVVDDQRDVRRVLRAGLESLGSHFQVTDVPSAEEALLVVAIQPVDLLIADVRLPGLSGLELRQRVLVNNPDLKMILITGATDPEIRRQVETAGADARFGCEGRHRVPGGVPADRGFDHRSGHAGHDDGESASYGVSADSAAALSVGGRGGLRWGRCNHERAQRQKAGSRKSKGRMKNTGG